MKRLLSFIATTFFVLLNINCGWSWENPLDNTHNKEAIMGFSSPVIDVKMCTKLGCEDGLTIELERAQWAHGTYKFDFDIDGIKESCEATLPFSGCEELSPSCTSARLRLMLSGCALPSTEHELGPLQVLSTDIKTMKLTVLYNGNKLSEKTFNPEYKMVQPNGPDCEPTCYQAPSGKITF